MNYYEKGGAGGGGRILSFPYPGLNEHSVLRYVLNVPCPINPPPLKYPVSRELSFYVNIYYSETPSRASGLLGGRGMV